MRAVPPGLDPTVVAAIDARLDDVETSHGVRVGWAVESGSRAWGFPSPDSDYDCRFLYLRPIADHLTPWPARDVIETPLDAVLDVNGWDLRKAVALLVDGNATVLEWLASPIVYRGEEGLRDLLHALAEEVTSADKVARHYWHLGRTQWSRLGGAGGQDVSLKGLFYAIRPAAALHWLAAHPGRAVVPMTLQELLREAPPEPAVSAAVEGLVANKAVTRELGNGAVPAPVRAFVERWLDGDEPAERGGHLDTREARERAEDVYRQAIALWSPDGA